MSQPVSKGAAKAGHQVSWLDKALVRLMPLAPKPLIRQVAKRYVAGVTLNECLDCVAKLNAQGLMATIDFLGEFINHPKEAHETALMYKDILRAVKQQNLKANISVKLSALGLLLDPILCEGLMLDLCFYAKEYGNFIRIDMEDSSCTDATIELYLKLRQQYDNVGIVLQAYLKRTQSDVEKIMQHQAGHFRLCKGIYIEPANIAFTDDDDIRSNYQQTLCKMFDAGAYVGIATHDKLLVDFALSEINQRKLQPTQYEFQMLLGVTESIRTSLVQSQHPVRVYVPFGYHWYGYSMRRLNENPKIAGYVFRQFLGIH